MSKESHYWNIKSLKSTIARCTTSFPCPVCQTKLLPKNFESHFQREHDLDPKVQCVWCQGQFTWTKNKKYQQVDHLKACYDYFVSCPPPRDPTSASAAAASNDMPPPVLLDLSPLCEPRRFFGHTRLPDLPARAFALLYWTTTWQPLPLRFQNDSLDAASAYVRQYLDDESLHWVHAMVKAVAFENFSRAMDEAGGAVTALPFSCWCDGGTHASAALRQHRHLILASTYGKVAFKKLFWDKVKVDDRSGLTARFPCKRLKKIESPLHLVNAMGYVSRRESRCQFSFDKFETRSRLNHFYIFKALPKEYKLPLVLGWDEGVLEHLRWETLKNVSLPELASAAADGTLVTRNGKYARQIRHFFSTSSYDGRLRQNIVLPVMKHFVPAAAAPTNDDAAHLCLTGGRRLIFESDRRNETLGEEEWLRLQAERGNLFFHAVRDDWWAPRRNRQITLNTLVPIVKDNVTLKRKIGDSTSRLEACEKKLKESEELRASQESLIAELRLRVSELERDALSKENDVLKAVIEEKDTIIARLKRILEENNIPDMCKKQTVE